MPVVGTAVDPLKETAWARARERVRARAFSTLSAFVYFGAVSLGAASGAVAALPSSTSSGVRVLVGIAGFIVGVLIAYGGWVAGRTVMALKEQRDEHRETITRERASAAQVLQQNQDMWAERQSETEQRSADELRVAKAQAAHEVQEAKQSSFRLHLHQLWSRGTTMRREIEQYNFEAVADQPGGNMMTIAYGSWRDDIIGIVRTFERMDLAPLLPASVPEDLTTRQGMLAAVDSRVMVLERWCREGPPPIDHPADL